MTNHLGAEAANPEKINEIAYSHSRQAMDSLSYIHALTRAKARGTEIATIIDVGAAKGAWGIATRKFWPESNLHFVEANEGWRPALKALADKDSKISYTIKGMSDEPGVIFFPITDDPFGGAVFKQKPDDGRNYNAVPATSVDTEVDEKKLLGPYLLKLDTHGTEVDILNGAIETLKNTALICIEMYNFGGQKRFAQLIVYLEELGFRCIDVCEPMFRPIDGVLWQMDFIMAPRSNPAFSKLRYK